MKEIIIAYDENTEASPVMGDWVGELVRCEDCLWNSGTEEKPYCQYHDTPRNPNWFCASGENKLFKGGE